MLKLFLSYLAGYAASGPITILSAFFMIHWLTPEDYSKGMLFIAVVNFLFFLCKLGMDQVFVRFFYESDYKSNTALLLFRCFGIVFTSFLILTIGLLLGRHYLNAWLKIESPLLVLMILIGTALFTLNRFAQLIARLRENVKIYNLARVLNEFFFLLCFTLIFYTISRTFWAIIFSQVLAMSLVILWLFSLFRHDLLFPIAQWQTLFNKKALHEFLYYGTPSLFSLSLTWLFVNIDRFFILRWSNFYELGIYIAAFVLVSPLEMVQSIFNTALAPKMNKMLIQSPFKAKKTCYDTFKKLNFALVSIIFVMIFLKEKLILFLGPSFQAVTIIFPWLLLAPYFRGLSEVVVAGIIKTKKSYWHPLISLCALVINVIGCYALIPSLGAEGAAIAVALSFGAFFLARLLISFQYYRFKINAWKCCFSFGCLLLAIIASRHNHYTFPLFCLLFSLTAMMEKDWLLEDGAHLVHLFLAQKSKIQHARLMLFKNTFKRKHI